MVEGNYMDKYMCQMFWGQSHLSKVRHDLCLFHILQLENVWLSAGIMISKANTMLFNIDCEYRIYYYQNLIANESSYKVYIGLNTTVIVCDKVRTFE